MNSDSLVEQAVAEFAGVKDAAALENAKARYLGRSGLVTELLKSLGKLPVEERKQAGSRINAVKAQIEQALDARRASLRDEELARKLREESIDVTQPGRGLGRGGLHPITRVRMRIES